MRTDTSEAGDSTDRDPERKMHRPSSARLGHAGRLGASEEPTAIEQDGRFADEGLLDGLDGVARAGRLELLRQLYLDGVSLDELKEAAGEDRLVLLPIERALSGDVHLDSSEVADLCGLDLDFVVAMRRALGLVHAEPAEPVFRERDVETFKRLASLRRDAGLPDEGILEVMRVAGQGLWRISEAIRTLLAEALACGGTTERELAARAVEAADRLGPVAGPLLEGAMHAHLREGLRNESVSATEISSGWMDDTWTVTVCFADLVGFTDLGERASPREVVDIAGHLASLAAEVASQPVRLIKTVGDAVMLVSTDAGALLEAALALMAAVESAGEPLPSLRTGIAHGPAFTRGGDWFGATVNLASRVTGAADPDTVLATRAVREAVPDDYRWRSIGEKTLKGVDGDVELFSVRRRD